MRAKHPDPPDPPDDGPPWTDADLFEDHSDAHIHPVDHGRRIQKGT